MADQYYPWPAGLAVDWAAQNPILPQGVAAWETDTLTGRVGDGVTPYNKLGPMFGPGAGQGVVIFDDSAQNGSTGWTSSKIQSQIDASRRSANQYTDNALQNLSVPYGIIVSVFQNADSTWPQRPQLPPGAVVFWFGVSQPPSGYMSPIADSFFLRDSLT